MIGVARAVFLVLVLLASTASAQAPDRREEARRLANEGADHYDRGQYPAALDKLRRAEALMAVPTIGLHVARALVALGRLREAEKQYQRAIDMPVDDTLAPELAAIQAEARQTARAERSALLATMPKLEIRSGGAEPERLSLDGEALDPERLPMILPVDPREHVVEAWLGSRRWSDRVRLEAAETKAVVIDLPSPSPLPAPVPLPPRPAASDTEESGPLAPLGWVSLGVGGALTVVSLASYGAAAVKSSDLEERCPDGVCRQSEVGDVRDEIDGYHALKTASLVTGIAGGTLIAGGLALLLVVPAIGGEQDGAFVAPIVGPTMGVHGRF